MLRCIRVVLTKCYGWTEQEGKINFIFNNYDSTALLQAQFVPPVLQQVPTGEEGKFEWKYNFGVNGSISACGMYEMTIFYPALIQVNTTKLTLKFIALCCCMESGSNLINKNHSS